MPQEQVKEFSWDFFSKLIILIFCIVQIARWRILPQFMDIYYHLQTAWGFLQAGGYSGWDFWQYAPVGRVHIYPPFFHIILAFLIKSGISKIILAKLLETAIPILFLIVIWNFFRKNYTESLAFFTLIAIGSSFSFYLSLLNNIPATLAIIIGIFTIDQLLEKKYLRSMILLGLCFYTHIGASWFFALSVILYGLFNHKNRNPVFVICLSVGILASPILLKQWTAMRLISLSGISEKYFCEFKTLDYVLAFFGLWLVFKMQQKYQLLLILFLASFIFIFYPYRFFSAQGYLPIALLSAVSLEAINNKAKVKKIYLRYTVIFLCGYLLLFSPTILMEKKMKADRINLKFYQFDSSFVDMIFPAHNNRMASTSLWHPNEYLSGADIIKHNSQERDIIYSDMDIMGLVLASISERATSNGLLPEIRSSVSFDPVLNSKIIILSKDAKSSLVNAIVSNYNLIKIGENKLLDFYKNPLCNTQLNIRKASVPFIIIIFIGLAFIILYWQATKIEAFTHRIVNKKYLTW